MNFVSAKRELRRDHPDDTVPIQGIFVPGSTDSSLKRLGLRRRNEAISSAIQPIPDGNDREAANNSRLAAIIAATNEVNLRL